MLNYSIYATDEFKHTCALVYGTHTEMRFHIHLVDIFYIYIIKFSVSQKSSKFVTLKFCLIKINNILK